MNTEMSYLLGMVCGNGEIKRGPTETIISIDIPHKKLETESFNNVHIYVKASIADIKSILEPLLGTNIEFIQNASNSVLYFIKKNNDYFMREVLRFIGDATSHDNIRVDNEVFNFTFDERISFLKGFADVTGYIRRSNYFFNKYMHRVYLEVPNNWFLVIDICNLLKSVDVPVQNIDWAHPNIRDGNLTKYKQGNPHFWKKEHQIKIFANEFEPIGFAVIHKNEALHELSNELRTGLLSSGKNVDTHKYYWEGRHIKRDKEIHPSEDDSFIVSDIRGNHYSSWKDIARDLGYDK